MDAREARWVLDGELSAAHGGGVTRLYHDVVRGPLRLHDGDYGALRLEGLALTSTKQVLENPGSLRARLREQIVRARPTVVVLMLCSREDAARYREGAEAFVDRVFVQEEIEECLAFLKASTAKT